MGAVARFMRAEHRKLEALFDRAIVGRAEPDASAWAAFREELLRHIGIEERILLPAVQEARGGEPDPVAARLRLDHGALAALLVPSPTLRIAATVAAIFAEHEPIEEGPGGLFERADALLGAGAAALVERLAAAPRVPVSPHNDGPRVLPATERALERAGHRLLSADEVPGALARLADVAAVLRAEGGAAAHPERHAAEMHGGAAG